MQMLPDIQLPAAGLCTLPCLRTQDCPSLKYAMLPVWCLKSSAPCIANLQEDALVCA